MKTEIIFGIHPVFEAIRAGHRQVAEIYISRDSKNKRLGELKTFAESKQISVKQIQPQALDSMVQGQRHQGIAAKATHYNAFGREKIDILLEKKGPIFLLLLDGIVDTQNFGALIRTGLCAGVDLIVTAKDRAAPLSPTVSFASAGAMEHAVISKVTNIAETVLELKKHETWVAGLDAGTKQSLYKTDLTGRLALVIGGEEKGIRPLVKNRCDFLVKIPQKADFNSLNASAAGAVAMFEAFRQRQQ